MRSWFDVWLTSTLIWGTTVAQYDSCHFDDYRSVLIADSMTTGNYFYLNLPGVCDPRGDVSLRLISMREADKNGDLFVDFQEERNGRIRNRFSVTPSCLAFSVGNVRGSSVLMQADYGAPLLTIGPTIELSIGGSSVRFNASKIDINTRVQRLQICMNGTDAIFYLDCKEIETKPFTVSNSGINFVSILGERNVSTHEYKNFFDGAVQQLYTVQCTDEDTDVKVLSVLQCQSIPANSDESGTGCSQKVESNLTKVLNEVVSELPRPPEYMRAFCDVIVWRNVQTISPMSISGYRVRLFNPVTGQEAIRESEGYETFYILKFNEEDECFRQEATMVEIQVNLISSEFFDPFSAFSLPISLGCEAPATPSVYFELKNKIYNNNSTVLMSNIGENEDALLCRTNRADCCTGPGRTGEFFYPNGVMVLIKKHSPELYRNRGERVVRLNRNADLENEGQKPPQGMYCCEVPDACGIVQRVCINIV